MHDVHMTCKSKIKDGINVQLLEIVCSSSTSAVVSVVPEKFHPAKSFPFSKRSFGLKDKHAHLELN